MQYARCVFVYTKTPLQQPSCCADTRLARIHQIKNRSTYMKDIRNKIIILRLTEEEKEQAVKAAKEVGLTLSSYVRKMILGNKIVSKTDVQTLFELNKIGVNLNQLVRHINMLPVEENIVSSLDDINTFIGELKNITSRLV